MKVISYCVRNYHKTVAFFFSFLFFFFFGLACGILILRPETNPHPKWKQSPSHWNIKEFPKLNALKQNFIFNYVHQRFAMDSAETISSLLRVVQLGSLICLGSQLGWGMAKITGVSGSLSPSGDRVPGELNQKLQSLARLRLRSHIMSLPLYYIYQSKSQDTPDTTSEAISPPLDRRNYKAFVAIFIYQRYYSVKLYFM